MPAALRSGEEIQRQQRDAARADVGRQCHFLARQRSDDDVRAAGPRLLDRLRHREGPGVEGRDLGAQFWRQQRDRRLEAIAQRGRRRGRAAGERQQQRGPPRGAGEHEG
jgi:hypothetical protein